MEFLQIIWNSLTTENEVLINIISIPLTFLEVFLSVLFFTTALDIKSEKKQKIIYIIVMSISSIICGLLIPSPYNAFVNFVLTILYIKFIFKTTFFKSILALVFPIIITIFTESIVARIYSLIFKIDYVYGMNIPLHRFIGTLFLNLVIFAVYLGLKYFKVSLSKIEILSKKHKILLILNIIFGIILIGTQLYILTFYTYLLPTFILILNIMSILTYVGISFYTIFTVSKLETTSTNLEEAQLYNKTLEILHDNTRAFRHDFTNILIGMNGYIDKNDMEGLKKYQNQLLDDIKQTNNLSTLSPKLVNNPAVYNVLANKYYKADNLSIKINLEVFLDLNELHMKIYEFTRILGILMDNAIEASKDCEKKIINVTIRKDNRKHMELLIIENTYNNKDVDTEKIYEKGFSTKEGNTGLGLWEIRQILKKNNNLNLYTKKNDEYFSQQFEIYYYNKK